MGMKRSEAWRVTSQTMSGPPLDVFWTTSSQCLERRVCDQSVSASEQVFLPVVWMPQSHHSIAIRVIKSRTRLWMQVG